jgi:hypothetical protein
LKSRGPGRKLRLCCVCRQSAAAQFRTNSTSITNAAENAVLAKLTEQLAVAKPHDDALPVAIEARSRNFQFRGKALFFHH